MPPWIGAPWDGAGDESTSTGANLQGISESSGIVTGPVRVVRDTFNVIELEPGEILVCVMTTPAWTPLLGMAAALVTETGNAFSHLSIAAREYGFPCVVAVNGATARTSNG
jgi:phosphoenolpyruvate synthase/pyruvate phosphate dikinase